MYTAARDTNYYPFQREEMQEKFIRDAEIDPDDDYPEGYKPELMESWPTDKDLYLPEPLVPDSMKPRTLKEGRRVSNNSNTGGPSSRAAAMTKQSPLFWYNV